MLKINLNTLGAVAFIEGKPGESTIEKIGTEAVAVGFFRLVLSLLDSQVVSEWESFGPGAAKAVVEPVGGGWQLIQMMLTFFFSPRVSIRRSANYPLLSFSNVVVTQSAAVQASLAPALLSFDDISLSMAPTEDPDGSRRLVIPTEDGWLNTGISETGHPQVPDVYGIFLRRDERNGFSIVAAVPRGGLTMNHARVVSVNATSNNTLSFRVVDSIGVIDGSLVFESFDEKALEIGVDFNTKLALEAGDGGLSGYTWLGLQRVVFSDGKLRSAGFVDHQVLLRRPTKSEGDGIGSDVVVNETALFGLGDSFSFTLDVPADSRFDPNVHVAEFQFRDPRAFDTQLSSQIAGVNSDPWRRFYGLRIAGLFSNKGHQEVFDVDLALVRLYGSTVEGSFPAFDFQAGGKLDIDGEVINSIVAPKPDARREGLRSAAIVSRMMSLEISNTIEIADSRKVFYSTLDETLIEYRSINGSLTINNPKLKGPPIGLAARRGDTEGRIGGRVSKEPEKIDQWVMTLLGQNNTPAKMVVTANEDGLRPADKWVEPFRTITKKFDLIENPGMKIELIGPPQSFDRRPTGSLLPENGSVLEFDKSCLDDTKKTLVFSAAATALSLYPWKEQIKEKIEEYRNKAEDFIETMRVEVGFDFAKLTAEELKNFVRARNVDSLQVAYCSKQRGDSASRELKAFIDGNTPQAKYPNDKIKILYLPIDVGMSVVLFDKGDSDTTKIYADDIIRERGGSNAGSLRPTLLFDFGEELPTSYKLLDYDEDAWKTLAKDHPALWPRASETAKGGKPDPSDKKWVGIFMRDLPVQFVVPPGAREKIKTGSKLAGSIYDAINNGMQLRYGWLGTGGPTWNVTLANQAGVPVTPEGWGDDIDFQFVGLSILGSSGKPTGGEAKITLKLLKIRDDGTNKPLGITGRFGIDISKSDPIDYINLAVDDATALTSTSIPGFEQVKLTSLSSDLRTATLSMELTPSVGLSSALPIFTKGKPVKASLLFNFTGQPQSGIQFSLPTDQETNLFGKYPLTIQGIYLNFGKGGANAKNQVLIRGRLGLGIAGLEAIGVDIILQQLDGTYDFSIVINEIGVDLRLGDNFKMQGQLSWAPDDVKIEDLQKPGGFQDPLKPSDLPTVGKSRSFWGILSFDTGDFMGRLDMLMKVGAKGEQTYWVGALGSSSVINIGVAKFEDPALVVAHNADFGDGLSNFITSPYASQVGGIRPPNGDLNVKRDWLQKWTASKSISMVFAGSGYFHLADTVAESPKNDNGGKYLTALIASDSGLFRIDAQTKFMKTAIIGFGVAINTKKKLVSAGIRIPEIAVPDKKNPKYIISPGHMAIEFSYAPDVYRFLISIGWPELASGSDLERDWTQSTKVYIAGLYPINTFYGGYRALLSYNGGSGEVRFGFAIRAGWTWSTEMNGADISKASAELGITLGGVLEFAYVWSRNALESSATTPQLLKALEENQDSVCNQIAFDSLPRANAPQLDCPIRRLGSITSSAAQRIDEQFGFALSEALAVIEAATALDADDLIMIATIYGDIWGKGSLEFMGVTLASVELALRLRFIVCGTLRRGITKAYGRGEIEVEVKLFCVKYSGKAGFDMWLKRGECPPPLRSALSF